MLLLKPVARLIPSNGTKLSLPRIFALLPSNFSLVRRERDSAPPVVGSLRYSGPAFHTRASAVTSLRATMSQFPESSSPKQFHSAVLYHYPCPDGIFAALAANSYHQRVGLKARFIPHTVYNPKRVEEVPVDDVEVVYLLDFAGPPGFAVELAKKAKRVVILDHHKTAAESLPPPDLAPKNLEMVIDMERSGATIALDYFSELVAAKQGGRGELFGGGRDEERVRRLFAYIEDADIWRWLLPESKEFSAGFGDLDIEFDANANASVFDQLVALEHEDLVRKGSVSIVKRQRVIDEILSQSFAVRLGGTSAEDSTTTDAGRFGLCLGVVANQVSNLRSELGNQLAAKSAEAGLRAIGVMAYTENAMTDVSKIKVSLRSKGEEDTTKISEAYGGGGHKNASAFTIDRNEFEAWKIRD